MPFGRIAPQLYLFGQYVLAKRETVPVQQRGERIFAQGNLLPGMDRLQAALPGDTNCCRHCTFLTCILRKIKTER